MSYYKYNNIEKEGKCCTRFIFIKIEMVVNRYQNILKKYGTKAGQPFVKHLDGKIWELRPLRDRIFFVAWFDGSYILLHHFMKKTQETPMREISKAKKELADLMERSDDNE